MNRFLFLWDYSLRRRLLRHNTYMPLRLTKGKRTVLRACVLQGFPSLSSFCQQVGEGGWGKEMSMLWSQWEKWLPVSQRKGEVDLGVNVPNPASFCRIESIWLLYANSCGATLLPLSVTDPFSLPLKEETEL